MKTLAPCVLCGAPISNLSFSVRIRCQRCTGRTDPPAPRIYLNKKFKEPRARYVRLARQRGVTWAALARQFGVTVPVIRAAVGHLERHEMHTRHRQRMFYRLRAHNAFTVLTALSWEIYGRTH